VTERIVEISESAARLSVRYDQLVIERDGAETVTTPLEEVAVLVLATPQVVLSQAVMTRLLEKGGMVVLSGSNHAPAGMVLPLETHSTQAERFRQQAEMKEPVKKRLWQQLVRAKMRAQGRLLERVRGSDGGLGMLAERVRSGDPENLEAQAARKYWPLLFADAHFRRGREGPDQNRHLNYGYAVLRAVVARAVCAAGLHPALGLEHHNRYDPFCLASDLMEPLRPVVDRAVWDWVQEHDATQPLEKEAKAWLLRPMFARYELEGEERTLFDAAARMASSLAHVSEGREKEMVVPEV
jgi:CRISPR-associated protein Cas1